MKHIYLVRIFKSPYCLAVFAAAFLAGYLLVPKIIFFNTRDTVLVTFFLLGFSLTFTCMIHMLKERIVRAKRYKTSVWGVIATIIGFAAVEACGIGGPLCGASLSAGLLGVLFPGFLIWFFRAYSRLLIVVSIFAQVIVLYAMGCFRKIK